MNEAEPVWNEKVNNETVKLAYEEAKSLQPFMSSWSDAVDAKVIAVFGIASVLIGAIPAIAGTPDSTWEWLLWLPAALFWAGAGWFSIQAFLTLDFRVGPVPGKLLEPEWAELSPEEYRFYRMRDMAKDYSHNRKQINRKAVALWWSIAFVAAESLALVLALFAQSL